jgi:ATP-dependent helicase Lhr and Lhr-like helicase
VLSVAPVPRYLSAAAVSLLSEARAAYTRYKLAEHMIVRDGADTVLFPWAGSRATQTLAAQLTADGLEASDDGLVITILKADPGQVRKRLERVAEAGAADPVSLALRVANKKAAKYDDWIEDTLLSADYARRSLDCPGAWRQACAILETWPAGL